MKKNHCESEAVPEIEVMMNLKYGLKFHPQQPRRLISTAYCKFTCQISTLAVCSTPATDPCDHLEEVDLEYYCLKYSMDAIPTYGLATIRNFQYGTCGGRW